MDICIIGSGVSGLLSAVELSKQKIIDKITIIESKKIPSIMVGESTIQPFFQFIEKHFDVSDFVKNTDASVKYGVKYSGWSKRSFLHGFTADNVFLRHKHVGRTYCELLSNKDPNVHLHELISVKLWKICNENKIALNVDEYPFTWHFDAGKFKLFLKKHLLKNKKINFVYDTIIGCEFSEDKTIEYIVGEDNKKYFSDYYINCSGENSVNIDIFKENYESYSSYLLTNKAVVYPLHYTNKSLEFHPYTVAKTMKNGWRWITPTQSRIGTGYVFSNNHVSEDEAVSEFLEDIGDKTINPIVVDFLPKINKRAYKFNNCTIGMSSGFLEPLDAPGLSATLGSISNTLELIKLKYQLKNNKCSPEKYISLIQQKNLDNILGHRWWCSFILHQYKTCMRNDTQFWIDHKNVKCNFYDELIGYMKYPSMDIFEKYEFEMFYKTTAGKDINGWSTLKQVPEKLEELDSETVDHSYFIDNVHKYKLKTNIPSKLSWS